ncbi:signal recognition particle 9 kDa protein-like [Otolemur garnettii]|uniref:signal recognition particle 9 kDa protein-like n=1 Tax=Otolemur garnettii TaxID=30611 RepID=UPI000C7EB801|nr:signal recognition particle 9 kDa protein-like [Otolemur garnettii]
MSQYQTWEEFSQLTHPIKTCVVLKYRYLGGSLYIRVTDDLVCLMYRTDQTQDVKKIEKFHSQLMELW